MRISLRQYLSEKNSESIFLGSLPSHWKVRRLKRELIRNDSGVWGQNPASGGTIVIRSTEQTVDGTLRLRNPALRLLSPSEEAQALLRAGDLVITKSSGSSEHIGKTSLITEETASLRCCFSNFLQRIRLGGGLEPNFVWYFLNNIVGREQLVNLSSTTTGLANLSGSIIGNILIVVPPLDEQAAIVRFLDHVDRKIRRFIQAKRRLIELTNERLAALVEDAMAITTEWPLVKLGHHVDLLPGFAFPSSGFTTASDDVKLLRGVNVAPGLIRWDQVVRWPIEDAKHYTRYSLMPGDIVIGMDRPWISTGIRVAKINASDTPSLLLQRVARIRPKPDLIPDYVMLLLSRPDFLAYFEPILTGVSVPHISPSQIAAYRFNLPPLKVQHAILEQVNRSSEAANLTAQTIRDEVSLIREYRTRLIADVVTGKLDVREAAERLPSVLEPVGPEDEAFGFEDAEEADNEASELLSAVADED